jgi:methylenetetrahydrofolate dehydrogenase (NADP+)/methenyltetrahydrofolate cyclohydrolase
MRLFNGRKVADKILDELKADIKKNKLKPKLAVILVGEDEPSKIYVRLKKEAGRKVGIKVDVHRFEEDENENVITKKIMELSRDKEINGIIVQLPLPPRFKTNAITGLIDPEKDVDGFHKANQQLLQKSKPRFISPLPAAILLAARAGTKNMLKNKKAAALVNSRTFGDVLKIILEREGVKFDYSIKKVCMISGSEEEFQEADILITACGCPNLVGKEMIKKGAVVIDAGITRYHNKKVVGDVNRDEITKKAGFLTPVPGGVGPVAVALLLKNVLVATLQNYK